MNDDHADFLRALRRLGAIFTNLEAPSGDTVAEWYRAFRKVPIFVLEDAVGRAIERHDATRILPAAFRAFVDETLRDHRARRTLELDQAEDEVCRDPACDRCGGKGSFTADVNVGTSRHEMTVVCRADDQTEGSTDGKS